MMRLVLTFLVCILIISCGSSSKQRLGESFTLHGIAGPDDNNQCTLLNVNDIIWNINTVLFLCMVLENQLETQRLILRDYDFEVRIPGALVQPPIFRVTIGGTLEPKKGSSGGSGGGGSGGQNPTPGSAPTPGSSSLVFTDQSSTKGSLASIPIQFPPVEFIYWLFANLGAFPAVNAIPAEAVFKAYAQTSPAGDWISTNKHYFRFTMVKQ
ncbi:MAG: hypothetical protein NZO16_05505 [Deltaproteobacteria bacterium]|nr:hypothetical protein [Deltaproteobacteria bacterium]